MLADIVPTFSIQSQVSKLAAEEFGLKAGTPISYRAGDQPNNALSLNVFNPGEIASTAGTSGVVYGVLGDVNYDPKSRVNTFAHVNYTKEQRPPGCSALHQRNRYPECMDSSQHCARLVVCRDERSCSALYLLEVKA